METKKPKMSTFSLLSISLIIVGFIFTVNEIQASENPSALKKENIEYKVSDFSFERDAQKCKNVFNENETVNRYLGYVTPKFLENPETPSHAKVLRSKNNKFIGMVSYHKKANNPSEGYLAFILVGKGFRGKGFGKLMLIHAIQDLKDQSVSKITLRARPDNPAIRLYERLGFKKVERKNEEIITKDGKKIVKDTQFLEWKK